ncbi:MAG: DUF5615 family PIN-like protein [Gammaproteobacteria bacterium]|nr:DUF5615 family PIN-like protein [Gammaproteobacteria bacterium]
MKLLANENIPIASVSALREAGYDILSITEEAPGLSDEAVLRRAQVEERIVLTFDRDYGELLFRKRLPAPAGVVYLRFLPAHPREAFEHFQRLIASGIKLVGSFTTADQERVMQRPL